jgi:predicted lipid-binding transport protein (Tim44 family)
MVVRRLALLGLAAMLAVGPQAWAAPGRGASIGSRGSRTYILPPRTPATPFGAQPFQRTITPPPYAPARPGYGTGAMGVRARAHPFATGFLGGLFGAGLAGLLLGHGLFGGMSGGAGLLGILLQVGLLVLLVRWLLKRLRSGGVAAYAPSPGYGQAAPAGLQPIEIGRGDYAAFEAVLREVMRAWTMEDMPALGRVATPEMVGILADQRRELARRGARNSTTDVKLEKGDLAEAWREETTDYATVAMRWSAIDIDTDATGRVLAGDPTQRAVRAEYWTFVRRPYGAWILSAIQQG